MSPRTMKHSNLIEGLWSTLKYFAKHVYNTLPGNEDYFISYLFEAAWKRKLSYLSGNDREEFLQITY